MDGQGAAGDVLARVVERLRRLLRDCNHPLDYARHKLDPSRLEELVAAVLRDPLAALYPLPVERVVAIARAACVWN